jgi:TnpA family transposase
MPRLKNIYAQRLHLPDADALQRYPNLAPILHSVIDWALIRRQYDELVKYATALRLGTADTESILKRFTRTPIQHPTYKALSELGRAVKTVFLCRYLAEESVRQEIAEGLNVVENWNSANGFIFYGRHSEIHSNDIESQTVSILSMHLLQACLVYLNTLMLQQVLADPAWFARLTPADWRGLTPLFYRHINPYGQVNLDLYTRIPHLDPLEA